MKTDTEGEGGRQRENQARNISANGVAAGGGGSSRGERRTSKLITLFLRTALRCGKCI